MLLIYVIIFVCILRSNKVSVNIPGKVLSSSYLFILGFLFHFGNPPYMPQSFLFNLSTNDKKIQLKEHVCVKCINY